MRVILRPRSESDTALMGELFPGLAPAMAKARQRPDIPVAATDQDNADMAEQTPGSLVGSTLTQLELEERNLRLVPIDGVSRRSRISSAAPIATPSRCTSLCRRDRLRSSSASSRSCALPPASGRCAKPTPYEGTPHALRPSHASCGRSSAGSASSSRSCAACSYRSFTALSNISSGQTFSRSRRVSMPAAWRSTSTHTIPCGNIRACGWPTSSSCPMTTAALCGSGLSTAPGRWCSKTVRRSRGLRFSAARPSSSRES